jgi:hypothetical protein
MITNFVFVPDWFGTDNVDGGVAWPWAISTATGAPTSSSS